MRVGAAITACLLLAPATAAAHPEGHHLHAAEVMRWWSWDPLVLVAIALTAFLTHHGWNAWLLLPVFVAGALGASTWRALR